MRESELSLLTALEKPSQYGGTKRLYLESEIEDIFKRLPKILAKEKEEHQEELKLRKYQRDLDRQADALQARLIIESFKAPELIMKSTGKLGLPQEIVRHILDLICDEFGANEFRLLTFVLDDLHNIALSCPDFLAALTHCYQRLAVKIGRLPSSDKRDWDEYIANPTSLKSYNLKEALKDLKLKVTGTKAGEFILKTRRTDP